MSDIKLDGDAAVVGGIHTDSHNTQNNYNTTNNSTVNNKTVYEAQKTQTEIYQQNERLFLEAVQERLVDGKLDNLRLAELNQLSIQWQIAPMRASQIIDQVRRNISVMQGSKGNEFLAEQTLNEVFNAIQTNHTDILQRKFNGLEQLARVMTSDNNIQFYYHLLLASMYPDKCALAFFGSRTDNYWQLFWAHVAFIKTGNVDNATVLLPRMGGFGCPQGDIALLMALDNLADYHKNGKQNYYRQQTLQYLDQAVQNGMSEPLGALWYAVKEMLEDKPQPEEWYQFYCDTTLAELKPKEKSNMAVPPQMPTPPPMPKFNAQNVKLNQMRGFNALQAANNMGLGIATPPPMPGASAVPSMPGQSKSAPQPAADALEARYGIILTNANALARKYGCSTQDVYDVFNDFIQNAYDQRMYWTFLDIAQYGMDSANEPPSWIECNEAVSRCIAENKLTAGADLHLFIIGGDDVIPIPRVEDPWPYGSERIPTDTCYAFEGTYIVDLLDNRDSDFTVGCARNNVARLPLEDGKLSTDIRSDLGAYFNISGMYGDGIPVGNVLMISNRDWIPASCTMTQHLPLLYSNDDPELIRNGMYISPKLLTQDAESLGIYCKSLDNADMLMFNLHGADAKGMCGFYSEAEAFNPSLLSHGKARVFNTVACFGARYAGYERNDSMLLSALYGGGVLLYTGSLVSVPMFSNGETDEVRELILNPGTGSEVLMRLYPLYQFKGMTGGKALLQAKCDYFNMCRNIEDDCFSMSTALMFCLYGNPMLNVRRSDHVIESALRNDAMPPAAVKADGMPLRKTMCQRLLKKDMNSQSLIDQIRGYVDDNLNAIRTMVEQHLYRQLGLNPQTLDSIDQFSRPTIDGNYEMGYSFNYHDPNRQYGADTFVEVDTQGKTKRIYTTKKLNFRKFRS
ncbi:hypothetical protein [uncultured Prevotella sp.]|uniref:hypothetical protein n=1 Tax=uncultured Prevotella sp. TaxID=159272 RepID=UPI0027E29D6E|nr:hypothetical protein [uncultured Prevotella sp.]